jgi:hypothetical protein
MVPYIKIYAVSTKKERATIKMDNDNKEKEKKQLLLRVSSSLWKELAAWAEDDFRSINGQIEYLLTEAVKQRKKRSKVKDIN